MAQSRSAIGSSTHRWGARRVLLRSEGLRFGAGAPLQQNFDFLLRGFQGTLAVARQLDAALEGFQSVFQRQIAALQSLHQALELSQRLLEIEGFIIGHQSASAPAISRGWRKRATR